ncbi:MAG: type II CAAX endopeptidase family protein [Pseudomonadota bacterium]
MNVAFQNFIAPAKPRIEIWRVLATLAVWFVLYLALSTLVLGVFEALQSPDGANSLLSGRFDTPIQMIVLFSTFVVWVLALALPLRLFHKRGLGSLLGAGFGRLAKFFIMGVLFYAGIIFLLGLFVGSAPVLEDNLAYSTWLRFLVPGLILLLIQVSAEELLFRGYLQQQLAARFNKVWPALVIPSVLFSLGHFTTDNGVWQGVLLVCATGLLGLLLAEVTYRTGNLGAAIGIHFLNNLLGMFVVSYQEFASGLALYRAQNYYDDPSLFERDLVFQVWLLFIGLALYYLFRLYQKIRK